MESAYFYSEYEIKLDYLDKYKEMICNPSLDQNKDKFDRINSGKIKRY